MKTLCSRCHKKCEPLFQYEIRYVDSLKVWKLCPECTKWSLIYLLGGDDVVARTTRDRLFGHIAEISDFINETNRKKRAARQQVQPVQSNVVEVPKPAKGGQPGPDEVKCNNCGEVYSDGLANCPNCHH